MNIRKIIQEEVSDFDWTNDIGPIEIGGMNLQRTSFGGVSYPIDYVAVGDKVISTPTTHHPKGFVFTVEEFQDSPISGVWGSDMPEDKKWSGFGALGSSEKHKNWQYTHALRKYVPENIQESDFEWASDIPVPSVGTRLRLKRFINGNTPDIGDVEDYTVLDITNDIVTLQQDDHRTTTLSLDRLMSNIERGRLVYLNESDFEWMDEIQPKHFPSDEHYTLFFGDVPSNEKTGIVKRLFGMGYKWNWTEDMDFPNFNTIHLNYPTKGLMTYSNRSLDTIRKQHSSGDIRMVKSDEFLSESDFDWVNKVDSMKIYSVQQLEDGKYYVFHPKKDVVDPQRPGSPPPDWVHDYEGQTIQVIHNDRIGRRIEFIPHGKITRMRWKEKTTSVTLDHMAQMFVYGEFSEVQGINESDDFGWTGDVESSEILVNDKFRIPTINPDGSNYSIIQVNKIVIETYFERTKNGVLKPNRVRKISFSRHSGMGELQVRNEVMNEDNFLKYITREGMVPFYTNRGYKNINESSDFNWMEKVNHISFEYLNNKALEFDPPLDNIHSVENILDELKELGFTSFDPDTLIFEDEDGMEHVVGLYMADGHVVWTGDIFETYQEHIDDYADRHVEIIDGNNLFGSLITESNDFGWVDDVSEYHSVLNKAFYFYPVARRGDNDYKRLVQYFKSLGFEPMYSTPDNTDSDSAVGLYAYRNRGGELSYVYTHDDEDDYENHILGFASDKSEDGGKNLEVIDARDFIKNL